MFKETVALVFINALLDALLGALTTRPAGALWSSPTLRLFTNNVVFGPTTQLSDLNEMTVTGYSGVALSSLTGPVQLGGHGRALLGDGNFLATSAPMTPEDAYGYYITDGSNAVLYAGETFDNPVPFVVEGSFLGLQIIIPLDNVQIP